MDNLYIDRNKYCIVPVGDQFSWRNAVHVGMACYEAIGRGHTIIALDMTSCAHIDSSGLARVADVHKRVAARGGRVGFLNPTPAVRTLMNLYGINSFVQIFSTEEDILRSGTAPEETPQ